MSVLNLCTDSSNSAGKTIKDIFNEVFGNNDQREVTIPRIVSLAKDRRNKVIMLRRQLAHGTYDLDERLDAVLDRILMDITPTQRRSP
jgi:hypothetical protein